MTAPAPRPEHSALLAEITAFFAAQPSVVAVALSGSSTRPWHDEYSDLDLYVYGTGPVPLEARRRFILPRAVRAEVGNAVWEEGDEWDEPDGTHLDVMYRSTALISDERQRRLVQHRAQVGYTTAVLSSVRHARALHDPGGWLAGQIRALSGPYPEALRRAVVAKNWPLLRGAMGSFTRQLGRAAARRDWVAVNQRLAAYLSSYSDILFAVNRTYHPGEKRLAERLEALPLRPPGLGEQLARLLERPQAPELPERLERLTDGLEELLRGEHLLP